MINRNNYHLVKEFLDYLRDVTQIDRSSLDRYWSYLKHLLRWADEVTFCKVVDKRPAFATYLTSQCEGEPVTLAPLTVKKIFQTAKRFFQWAKATYPRNFKEMQLGWIEALRLPRSAQAQVEHEFVQLEEVQQLAALEIEPSNFAMRRDQAAAAMLFLSGMRAGAFASLTIECVDLPNRTVKQWPSLGVKTKNRKSATTNLLNIPELLAVAEKWDSFVRGCMSLSAPWYTPIINQWGEQVLSPDPPGANRNIALAKRLRKLFSLAGLPYRSPHKFRHGHAVFALQHANTMADYKAVSMNLMHADIRVTDGIYAPLASDEVKQRIAGLTVQTLAQKAMDGKDVQTIHHLSDDELLIALAQRLNGSSSR